MFPIWWRHHIVWILWILYVLKRQYVAIVISGQVSTPQPGWRVTVIPVRLGVCQTCGMHISTDGRIFSVQSSMGLSRPGFGQRRGHLPPWWRHQMETFSALLAVCAGNSPVPGEFPTQRPVTRGFDVFFDLRLNNRLSKQWWGWWNENLSRSLWRHRNAIWHQWSPDCGTPYAYLRNHVIDLLN